MSFEVKAPMAGKFVEFKVNAGDTVKEKDEIAVIEAMKMYVKVFAPKGGVVKELVAKSGDVVDKNTVLLTLE